MSGNDACTGSLLAALTEAGFLTELEKNRFVMAEVSFCVFILIMKIRGGLYFSIAAILWRWQTMHHFW